MNDDAFTERLSDYVDGELTPAGHLAVERHLAACTACRRTVDELRAVIARAGSLRDGRPDADLWPGIAARLGARAAGPARRSPLARALVRRVSFTLPQLAAAALALMVLSGGLAWLARSGDPRADFDPVNAQTVRGAAAPVALSDSDYDAAVADLEAVLAEERGRLDPDTVRAIDANLAAIDRAIAQSRQALAADPSNRYLLDQLAATRQRKLALLRRAAALGSAGR